MRKSRYTQLSDDEPEYEQDIEAQIARLRAVLALMSPESGSAALGALRHAAPDLPLSERVKALNIYRSSLLSAGVGAPTTRSRRLKAAQLNGRLPR